MPSLHVEDVVLDYPIYNVNSRRLRDAVRSVSTGGLIRPGVNGGVTYVRALDGITLHIEAGERIGLSGPNGAGKSTLLRMLAGVYHPTEGTMRIEGTVSPMFDLMIGTNPELSGFENIDMRCLLLGMSDEEIEEIKPEIAEFSELGDFLHLPVRTYSAGMKSRLGFSISTATYPEILLLDEWLNVADKEFKEKAARRMEEFVERSSIMVIASHGMSRLKKLCNRIVRLEHGRIARIIENKVTGSLTGDLVP